MNEIESKKLITFARLVKEEIITQEMSEEETLSLLSGYIKCNGTLSFKNQKEILVIRTQNAKIAKFIYKKIQELFHAESSFTYFREINLKKNSIYHIEIMENIDHILSTLELFKDGFPTYPEIRIDKKVRPFYLSGVFLAIGSVNSPYKDYHLEMKFSEEDDAKFILKILKYYKSNYQFEFKLFKRKTKTILYLKKADQIADYLSLIHAPTARLEFEDVRIERDFLNSENRLNICSSQNHQRTYKKAQEQLEYIRFLKESGSYALLSQKEKMLCDLRLDNEDASLQELSQLFLEKYNITISKSGVNHLFSSLKMKAEEFKRKLEGN